MRLTILSLKRIGSGITTLLMLAWLLWPSANWAPNAEPLVMFIMALGGWFYLELSERPPSHENDIRLARQFLQIYKYQFRDILKEADMLGLLNYETMSDVYEAYRQWREPSVKFFDPKVQKKFNRFMNVFGQFRDFYAQNGSPERVGATYGYSLRGRGESQGGLISQLTHDRSRKANELASEAWKEAQRFEKILEKRVPEAYKNPIDFTRMRDYPTVDGDN